MMDARRFEAEKKVLATKLPFNAYLFKDMDTPHPYLLMAAKTNNGKVYTLRIDLEDFPNEVPKAFVTRMLKTKDGNLMNGASGTMHTLSTEHGYTRICHYGWGSWTPMVSLFRVYIKCRLWLEMYEEHLRTGHPMDYYLKHQN